MLDHTPAARHDDEADETALRLLAEVSAEWDRRPDPCREFGLRRRRLKTGPGQGSD